MPFKTHIISLSVVIALAFSGSAFAQEKVVKLAHVGPITGVMK